MATIGLDMLHYAKITEDENGNESYGTPAEIGKGNERRLVRGAGRGHAICG